MKPFQMGPTLRGKNLLPVSREEIEVADLFPVKVYPFN